MPGSRRREKEGEREEGRQAGRKSREGEGRTEGRKGGRKGWREEKYLFTSLKDLPTSCSSPETAVTL